MRLSFLGVMAAALLVAGAACGGGRGGSAGIGIDRDLLITSRWNNVNLSDYAFKVQHDRISPGFVQFQVTNIGLQPHELLIVPIVGRKYGLPVAHMELPEPGGKETLALNLPEGSYALVCLVQVETVGGLVSHMELGMIAPLEVRK